ncbi:MAG: HAMP domain-containing histidine kinase [Paludibacteraceae bacterium]|nr:HAMP domain-containing histidine kinase [Paludibacteraceae bacterium]
MKTSFDNLKKIKYIFSSIALLIVGLSMYYTHLLTKEMAQEERQRISLWAEATHRLVTDTDESDLAFLMKVIEGNTNIPVLVVDETGNVTVHRNIEVPEENSEEFLREMAKKFQRENQPIEITIDENIQHHLYYGNSTMLNKLEYYPYIQWGIILAFFAIIFFVFASAKRSEQNRVWVGLSKETAHQLGTPISSLLAWVEILKEEKVNPDLMSEMEKDVNRLRTIAERFSKIGSKPELSPISIEPILQNSLSYMRKRTSNKVQITYQSKSEEPIVVALNQPLFEWVIENLCKNAIDAMEGEGHINVEVSQEKEKVIIDVSDTGKGIPKSKFDAVFSPGFTTKKRGWGLGLSLVKRIIEEYHKGKIFVKHSEIDKGTTFRIILNKDIKN